jgi:lipoate-protein ligase B
MNNDLGLFRYIVPCGIREFGVTSLVTAGITADMPSIVQYLTEEFAVVYDCLLEA